MEDFLDRVRTSITGLRQRRLGERAVAARLITTSQLEEALRESGSDLGERLVARGWVTRTQVDELMRTLDLPDAVSGFARYELLDVLGEGAMSVVHRGRDRQLGRIVAVKVLRESMFGHSLVRERFARESQALAWLDHPGVVKVFDAGTDGDKAYLVMELVVAGEGPGGEAAGPRGAAPAAGEGRPRRPPRPRERRHPPRPQAREHPGDRRRP